MRLAAVAVICLLLFAGCTSKEPSEVVDDEPLGSDGVSGQGRNDQLAGWVLDATLTPIEGATVALPGENATAVTGGDGYFGFNGLDTDRVMIVQATADGFKPSSKTVTLLRDAVFRMNFTLEALPVKTPYLEKQAFTGFIGCSSVVRLNDDRYPYDCSAVSPQDERVWDFNVNGDVAGIVIEVAWEYDTNLAEHLNVTVETVDLGIFEEVLAYGEGASIMQVQVTREQSERFYRQGGTVRVTVDVGRDIEGEETNVGAAMAIQQEFEVIASVFYVTGPPPGYTSA